MESDANFRGLRTALTNKAGGQLILSFFNPVLLPFRLFCSYHQ